jgi:hypothetical protein
VLLDGLGAALALGGALLGSTGSGFTVPLPAPALDLPGNADAGIFCKRALDVGKTPFGTSV